MLKRLIAKNIQCYPDLDIKFSPGLNIIIGESGTGKTTIYRMLKWCFDNRPEGIEFKEQFLRHDTKEAKVILKLDDCKVGRIRSNKRNSYLLNDRELKAVGRGKVPEDILKALRFHDINFQAFTDPNFLFNLTDSEVARYLNKIADLESIDLSRSSIKKEKTEIKNLINNTTFDLKEKKEKLNSYKWINNIEPEVNQLLSKEKEIRLEEKRNNKVQQIIDKLKILKKEYNNIGIDQSIFKDIKKIKGEVATLEEKENKINRSQQLLNDLKSKKKKYQEIKQTFLKLKKKFNKLMPNICPLCGKEK